MTHELVMRAYCGMPYQLEKGDLDDCRIAAARCIQRHRRTQREVAILVPGKEWELLEAEDGGMVADAEGVMQLRSIVGKDEW